MSNVKKFPCRICWLSHIWFVSFGLWLCNAGVGCSVMSIYRRDSANTELKFSSFKSCMNNFYKHKNLNERFWFKKQTTINYSILKKLFQSFLSSSLWTMCFVFPPSVCFITMYFREIRCKHTISYIFKWLSSNNIFWFRHLAFLILIWFVIDSFTVLNLQTIHYHDIISNHIISR